MLKFYIQAKINGRFKAINLSEGVPVDRLMFASFFADKDTADKACKSLSEQNPSIQFKVAKA